MLDKICTIFCKDWNASPSGFFSWSGRLGPGLRIAFLSQHLRDIATVDEDVGDEAIVDISAMRRNSHCSAAKQLFQPQPGGLSTWLVQFRRVDASESDALGPISKRVTINHLDLPTVNPALDATEWCEGLPTEQRSDTSATGSVQPFGFPVRMESFLMVKSVGVEGALGSCVWFPAEVAGRAKFRLG